MSDPLIPNLLDLVAVMADTADGEIHRGDVGTVVELLPLETAEVEFLDGEGHTRYIATLRFSDLLVRNLQRTRVA